MESVVFPQDYVAVREALQKRVVALNATKAELYAVPWSSEATAAQWLALKMRTLALPEFEIVYPIPPHGCPTWRLLAEELDKHLPQKQGFIVSYWPNGIRINYLCP